MSAGDPAAPALAADLEKRAEALDARARFARTMATPGARSDVWANAARTAELDAMSLREAARAIRTHFIVAGQGAAG